MCSYASKLIRVYAPLTRGNVQDTRYRCQNRAHDQPEPENKQYYTMVTITAEANNVDVTRREYDYTHTSK